MIGARSTVAGVLSLVLWSAPALGAEITVSRDLEIFGDDVVGQLARPVADMEAELAQQGCRAFSRAYWSDTTPFRTLHVEVRCKEGDDGERLSLR
jgi:hypothetical protein